MSLKPHIHFLIMMFLLVSLYCFVAPLRLHLFPYNLAGIIISAGGLWLLIYALLVFQENNTPERIDQIPVVIVTLGPYRFSRNPQYIGGFLMLLGASIIAPTMPGFTLPFLFIFLIRILFIPSEERKMKEVFGSRYEEYCEKVRRWL